MIEEDFSPEGLVPTKSIERCSVVRSIGNIPRAGAALLALQEIVRLKKKRGYESPKHEQT